MARSAGTGPGSSDRWWSRFRAVAVAAATATLIATAPTRAPAEEVEVDLELVLAVDISGSIDNWEAEQQRRGYLSAITHPEVLDAIQSGILGRIAVTYVEWAGDAYQWTVVPWTLIDGPEAAQAFAAALSEEPLMTEYWTSISTAIDYCASLFDRNGFEGLRRVIDISGDGVSNRGRPVTAARDQAVARGITINGLPILNDRPNPYGGPTSVEVKLDDYYREKVIGGPRSFLVVAESFENFAEAVLRKLILEIADRQPEPSMDPLVPSSPRTPG